MPVFNKDGSVFSLSGSKQIQNNYAPKQNTQQFSIPSIWNWYIIHNFEEEIQIKKLVVEEIKPVISQPKDERQTLWCLPAKLSERVDDLYGERKMYLQYGKKFNFLAVVKTSFNLDMEFYSESIIPKHSIVYDTIEQRWWVVNEEKDGNHYCIPSSSHPSFA